MAVIVATLWAARSFGGPDLDFTINPVMTKGPARAPVTIVEFSDYQ
jgi:hypothetical protein